MTESKLMEVVVEALLFNADPCFVITEERKPEEFVEVLAALKASNSELFSGICLENIEIFSDESVEESALVSNIQQLLDDRIKVVNMIV